MLQKTIPTTGKIEEKAMGFLELYAILALIAALGYFGIKYGLKAFEKYLQWISKLLVTHHLVRLLK